MTTSPPRTAPSRRRGGFALIEAVISALIVGLMLAASIELVGKSRASQQWCSDRVRAYQLAVQIMAEITDQPYRDPDALGGILGVDPGELLSSRADFDDVDDYNQLRETPPRNRDGSIIPGYADWVREVAVQWVNGEDASQPSAGESGIKRITVEITRGGRSLAQLTSFRTAAVNRR